MTAATEPSTPPDAPACTQPVTIFLSAAEASGDHHAAGLIDALRRKIPDARFVGVAGPQMAAAGCDVLVDLASRATMITGPFTRLGYYIRTVRRLQRQIVDLKPDLFIPVDSPALNWHLAKAARKAHTPIMHYVCPQVWAWARWRIKKLRRLTDHVACILPFEAAWLQHRRVPATFVGHPLFDDLPPRPKPLPDLVKAWSDQAWTIALLPGSRTAEIRQHTPAMLATLAVIKRRYPQARCLFTAANDRAAKDIEAVVARKAPGLNVEIKTGPPGQILGQAHFALAVSGTVTLEVAYYGLPMVVFYHVGKLDWEIVGRWLVQMPYLSLVNILSPTGRAIVPELMPWHGNVKRISSMVMEVLEDLGAMVEMRSALLKMVAPLHAPPGTSAADNAARLALRVLKQQNAHCKGT